MGFLGLLALVFLLTTGLAVAVAGGVLAVIQRRSGSTFGGRRDFDPLVVVFRPLRRAEVIRFWAFKDWKHGNTGPVERLRRRLLASR